MQLAGKLQFMLPGVLFFKPFVCIGSLKAQKLSCKLNDLLVLSWQAQNEKDK